METIKLALNYQANLEKIITYHQPSSSCSLENQSKIRTFTIELIVKGKYNNENEHLTLHPDYNYGIISKDLGISEEHLANMLVMVWNIIALEWQPHNDFVDEDHLDVRNNLMDNYSELIDDLCILKSGKDNIRKINIKTEAGILKVKSEIELKNIIDMLVENRHTILKEEVYKLLFNTSEIAKWSFEQPKNEQNTLKRSPCGERGDWLIGRHTSTILLKYLKGEGLLVKNSKTKISQKQGVLIYTVLLVFNLIKNKEALKPRSNEEKAKYIYSLLDGDKNLKKHEIQKTEWENYPLK